MVKAVLFDLDGTLWDRDGAVRQLLDAQHEAFSALAHIPRDLYVQRFMALDAHGVISDKADVYRQVVGEFDLPTNLVTEFRDQFWASFPLFQQPFPEVIATLDLLAGMGLQLGIITNGNTAVQHAKIQALGLEPRMNTILISDREGVRKPDPAIFQRALQRLGVTPDASWFVGDHPDADIRGAREAGLTAVFRRGWSTSAEHATHVISTLDELTPLISAARDTLPT